MCAFNSDRLVLKVKDHFTLILARKRAFLWVLGDCLVLFMCEVVLFGINTFLFVFARCDANYSTSTFEPRDIIDG